MNSKKTAIKVKGLTKKFGDFTAVDCISFEVYGGEIFGFLGPNGSGKTTTIRMMLGLIKPSEGSIEVLGSPVTDLPREILPKVGYMSQRFSLYNDLTVIQNLRFYGKAYGLSNQQLAKQIQNALLMSGLQGKENTPTGELAGGWRQRLALSAAILHEPEILFLDEPTAGVDPLSRRMFWDLLYDLTAKGITVFITTHYMDEAEHCQRLAFIQHGRIIAYGRPNEIEEQILPGKVIEIVLDDPRPAIQLLESAQIMEKYPRIKVELYGSLIHILTPEAENMLVGLKQDLAEGNIKPTLMRVIEPSLEDTFIAAMQA